LRHLGLDRGDVITIITTSQEQDVSTCVSVEAFNYASVARVVTDRTRVVIAIHEFGYVDTAFPSRCEEWRARGITVLEDCAHVAGIRVGSARAGDYGDAALFSLPKVIPARAGAVLRSREPFRLPPMDEARSSMTMEGKAVAEESFPHLDRLNALREERHQFLRRELGLPSWEPEKSTVSVPWYSMFTDPERRVDAGAFPNADLGGASLVAGRVQIPTNPLTPLSEFEALVSYIKSMPGDSLPG
jgi:hypothetical protein